MVRKKLCQYLRRKLVHTLPRFSDHAKIDIKILRHNPIKVCMKNRYLES